MQKTFSTFEHQYNISVGIFVAISVAGILKFLDISKLSFLGEKVFIIDWVILIFLAIITFLESFSIKNLFVKKDKVVFSKKQKLIDFVIKILFVIIIILFVIFTKII